MLFLRLLNIDALFILLLELVHVCLLKVFFGYIFTASFRKNYPKYVLFTECIVCFPYYGNLWLGFLSFLFHAVINRSLYSSPIILTGEYVFPLGFFKDIR